MSRRSWLIKAREKLAITRQDFRFDDWHEALAGNQLRQLELLVAFGRWSA
jgi:hypothetical protein